MSPTLVVILISIGLVIFIFVLRYLLNLGANKAKDAFRNSRARADEQKNSPKQENLADRYK